MRAFPFTALIAAAICGLASTGFAADAPPLPVRSGGIVGLDAMTGTVFQENQSSFSGIALRMRIRNAAFRPNLELLPTFEYWQNTSRLESFNIKTRRRDATLGADVRWVFPNKAWQPYVGAGFGLHFLDNELRAPDYGTDKASNGVVRGGLAALGGVQFGSGGRLGSFVELKYHNVSTYRQLKFNTGLNWNF